MESSISKKIAERFAADQTTRSGLLSRTWYLARRWPIIPLLILGVLFFAGIFAPMIAQYDPILGNLRLRNAPPALINPEWYDERPEVNRLLLGGDHVGRDVLSRVIHGARISIIVAGVSLGTGMVIGTGLGLLAGYYGGHIDEIILRTVDVWHAIPFLLFAMVASVIFGSSFGLVIVLLATLAWSGFVRNIRAEVLSIRELDFIAAAKISGASDFRILLKHLFPSIRNTLLVIATLRVGQLILAEASLSFLGVGIPSPTPAWGLMIAEGRQYVEIAWWQTVIPGLAIFLIVVSLNFLGDWIRDRLDPRLQQIL